MKISIVVCLMAFFGVAWVLRRTQLSLGLPVAYMANLLLLHLPGGVAHLLDQGDNLTPDTLTRKGMIFTAIGAVSFLAGVWIAQLNPNQPELRPAPRSLFWRFCVLAGGICTVASFTIRIPSISAVLERGGPIWMIGIILGLRSAMVKKDRVKAAQWLVVLTVYPVLMLLLGGFLSYGAMVTIIVLSALAVTARSVWRIGLVCVVLLAAGTSVFISYFEH